MLLNCGAEEDSWESQDYKIKLVNPKGNQSWIFIRRTDAEAETPILWLPDAKRQLTGKDADDEKDWGQEEKGMTEDEMVGWYHWLDGHEFEQALGDGEGQGSLACCSPWGHKKSDMTEQLNNKSIIFQIFMGKSLSPFEADTINVTPKCLGIPLIVSCTYTLDPASVSFCS